jgi:hypothetical protein
MISGIEELRKLRQTTIELLDAIELSFRKTVAKNCECFSLAKDEDFDKAGWFKCNHLKHRWAETEVTICQLKDCPKKGK